MRFTMILFLGLVLMTMNASGKPKIYLVKTADAVHKVPEPEPKFEYPEPEFEYPEPEIEYPEPEIAYPEPEVEEYDIYSYDEDEGLDVDAAEPAADDVVPWWEDGEKMTLHDVSIGISYSIDDPLIQRRQKRPF